MKNKIRTKLLILPLLLSIALITSWCTDITKNNDINSSGDLNNNTWDIVWMANPASVYCEENGWTLELIFDNGESYGMCHFQGWAVCEEREFFRKECLPLAEDSEAIHNLAICTEEAKECPDGSRVGRNWPDCEFDACPIQNDNTTTGDKSNKIQEESEEETITDILENHANTSWYQEEWLTEADIDLMEAIIEKLK